MRLEEVAKIHNLTKPQVKLLRSAMHRTWDQIYYDLVDLFEGGEAEMEAAYVDAAAMIAENTLDADRVSDFCRDMDLSFVYKREDGSRRDNVIKMGEDVLRAQQ